MQHVSEIANKTNLQRGANAVLLLLGLLATIETWKANSFYRAVRAVCVLQMLRKSAGPLLLQVLLLQL